MHVPGIEFVQYDENLLAHNSDYWAFDTDWEDYEDYTKGLGFEVRDNQRRLSYTKKLKSGIKKF